MGDEVGGGRSYWRWSKRDFFPEPSFSSPSAYRSSLGATPRRLLHQVLRRSTDADETDTRESENPLRRCLTWWDLSWLGFGAVVGTGIFVITGQEARLSAGPAIVLSYLLSGLSALLSSFCYAEFAVEIPSAGGSFSYLRVELGDFLAFIAAANILLEALVGAAGLARSWTSYFAAAIGKNPDSLRIHVSALADGYNLLDPLGALVLVLLCSFAMSGTRRTSLLNWLASILGIAVIAFIIAVGSAHANTANLTPFLPFGMKGVVQAAAVVYWAYTGFDMVATMAEETKNPARDIPLGLVGSMSAIIVVYCVMALVLVMMQRYDQLDVNAAYSEAFASLGMKWARIVVALGALKGMTTGILVGALGQARYTTQIARAHMIPPFFALVHPKTKTPIYATILVTSISAIIGFFTDLEVLASVSSISTLFIFMLMAIALLVRRYYVRDVTSRPEHIKFIVFLLVIIGTSIGISVLWNTNTYGWIGYAIVVPLWFFSTLGLSVFVGQKRAPKVWGVPMVPWLPSVSIAMNLFLMGSLGYMAYIRFGICTLVMLAYYVLVGVHATYDTVQQQEQEKLEGNNLEEGNKEVF